MPSLSVCSLWLVPQMPHLVLGDDEGAEIKEILTHRLHHFECIARKLVHADTLDDLCEAPELVDINHARVVNVVGIALLQHDQIGQINTYKSSGETI